MTNPPSIDKHVGQALVNERRMLSLPRNKAAKMVFCSHQALAKIEAGDVHTINPYVLKIPEILGVDPKGIFYGVESLMQNDGARYLPLEYLEEETLRRLQECVGLRRMLEKEEPEIGA